MTGPRAGIGSDVCVCVHQCVGTCAAKVVGATSSDGFLVLDTLRSNARQRRRDSGYTNR